MNKTAGSLFIIALILISTPVMGAESSDMQGFENYITHPSRVNHILENFSGDTIYPGNMGILSFRLFNPYNRSMENISLNAEIYAYETLRTYQIIDDSFSNSPVFFQGNGRFYRKNISSLPPGVYLDFNLTIETSPSTPEGVYAVRFILEFDYSNSSSIHRHFIMRSISYYSNDELDYATRDPTKSDLPYYRHGFNISYLNKIHPVDAIIPFTSFSVRRGIPLWPFFALVGMAGASAILAYMYYMNDNYGKYEWLDQKTRQIAGKYEKFRRSLYERARKR